MSDFDEYFDDMKKDGASKPIPPLNGKVVIEVKEAKVEATKDGLGKNLSLELRVGTKPWSGRKMFKRYFFGTTDDSKKKGATTGRRQMNALIEACGFILDPDNATEKQKAAMALGLAQPFTREHNAESIKGRFFIGTVKTPEPVDGERTYPELIAAEAIDPDQYQDTITACDFSRSDDGLSF